MIFRYHEEDSVGDSYRRAYLDGLVSMVEARREEGAFVREQLFRNLNENREQLRQKYRAMLGYPLTEKRCGLPKVTLTPVCTENGISVYRTQTELVYGIPFYGILYLREDGICRPLVVCAHGGMGTPELIAGILDGGSSNYNDMLTRVLDLGANVWAPQFLLWNTDRFPITLEGIQNVDVQRQKIDKQLRQLGSSITALEIYGVEHMLDWLCTRDEVDAERIGMVGLSYGGFYTLYCTAADTRIRAAVASCYFNNRFRYDSPDWVFRDAGMTFLDAEIAALVAPRRLILQVAEGDPLFQVDTAIKEYERYRSLVGEEVESVTLDVFEGNHEFSHDDRPLLEMMTVLCDGR